jgi:hypothetical protein
MIEQQGDWCILRTSSAHTLGLADALTEAGHRAWTPTEVLVQRARRTMPRKELIVPLMPSIVFAPYDSLAALIGISRNAMTFRVWDDKAKRMVVKGWPKFTVMRIGDRYAKVPDGHLAGLRMAQSVRLTLAKKKTFQPGITVRLMHGPGEGLRGTVEQVRGTFARVRFPGWSLTMMVAFHLLEAVVPDAPAGD